MTKIIHVNRQVIAQNNKDNVKRPCIIVRPTKHGKSVYCYSVDIKGPSKIVNGKLSCGAKIWIETDSEIDMDNPMSFSELKELG